MDSVKSVQLHFAFSSLSNWREGQRSLYGATRPTLGLIQERSEDSWMHHPLCTEIYLLKCPYMYKNLHISTTHTHTHTHSPTNTTTPTEEGDTPHSADSMERTVAGTLVAQPFSWRSLQTNLPVLRIATTGIRGTTLTLPPG